MVSQESDTDAIRKGNKKNLRDVDLQDADLQEANLRGAYLQGAYLQGADLWYADLQGAHLQGAHLQDAHLQDVDLQGADLQGAHLQGASLQGADLQGAHLQGADLQGAHLQGADLRDADLPNYQRLPEVGEFIAFKGCRNHVVKVRVPDNSERVSSLIGPKCRAEFVEVLEVLNSNGEQCDATKTRSWYDRGTVYREGKTVKPDKWDDNIRVQCTNGIHIYPTKDEAIDAVR